MGLKHELLINALEATQLFSEPLIVIPMSGGTVNQSYRLTSGDEQFFLKTFEQSYLIPDDRSQAYLLQQRVAELGIAVKPVYMPANQQFQIDQWNDNPSLESSGLSRTEQISEVAGVLGSIHSLQVPAQMLDLPNNWQRYLDIIGCHSNKALADRVETCRQIWFDSYRRDQVLCHNDLAFSHVLKGPKSLVIDWEYAAIGNRFFDLASCAVINELCSEDIHLLHHAYSEVAALPVEYVGQEVKKQRHLVELTNQLWYMAAGIDKP